MPDLGSDHFGVLFTIVQNNPNYPKSSNQRYNTKLANWDLFKDSLQKESLSLDLLLNTSSNYENSDLDTLAEKVTNTIVKAADISIPKYKVSILSKPWWNEELKALRKTMSRLNRKVKASEYTLFKEELT
jgi:hypothetical protein